MKVSESEVVVLTKRGEKIKRKKKIVFIFWGYFFFFEERELK